MTRALWWFFEDGVEDKALGPVRAAFSVVSSKLDFFSIEHSTYAIVYAGSASSSWKLSGWCQPLVF
jgi:hypothetical protein